MPIELVLAGQDVAQDGFHEWLANPNKPLEVLGEGADAALGFVAAAIQALPPSCAEQWYGRSVVVESAEAWRMLQPVRVPLLILLADINADAPALLAKSGHWVVVPLGREAHRREGVVILVRPRSEALEQALRNLGMPEHQAEEKVRSCGRSLTVLRRLMAIAPNLAEPDWAGPEHAQFLIPALLANGWDSTQRGDKEVLASLSGQDYPAFERLMARWLNVSDPPLRRAGSVWVMTAPWDAWRLLGRYLTVDDLARLRQVAVEVLGRDDPRFELDPDKRWMAALYDKAPIQSEWVREGLAESLAMLAVLGEGAGVHASGGAAVFAAGLVHSLLHEADGIRWASLDRTLPYLAEAAPDTFLDAVEEGLAGDLPPLRFLLQDGGRPGFGRCLHCNLLWSLETLAWSPIHLSRVVLILARLAAMDPGGQSSNRPSASLREILLPWLHHTAADVQARLGAFDHVMVAEPEVGWKLLLELLPGHHGFSINTHKPRWRDWAKSSSKSVTVGEYWEYVLALMDRAFMAIGNDVKRASAMLERLDRLSDELQQRLLDHLDGLVEQLQAQAERFTLWTALRKLLHRHRSHPGAKWVFPTQILDRLAAAHERLTPENIVERWSWVFDEHWPEVPEGEERDAGKLNQKAEAVRQQAVEAVWKQMGLDGVFSLAATVKFPGWVGDSVARMDAASEIEPRILEEALGSADGNLAAFGRFFCHHRQAKGTEAWFEARLSEGIATGWSPEKLAELCIALPEGMATWKRVAQLGEAVELAYWRKAEVWNGAEDAEAVEYAVEQFLRVDRVQRAFNLVAWKHPKDLPFSLLSSLMQRVLVEINTPDKADGYESWNIGQLFDALDESDGLDEGQMLQLEWAFLRALEDSDRGPKRLIRSLEESPDTFVQLLIWQYKPDGENDAEEELPREAVQAMAEQSHWLLHIWRGMPGLTDGKLDGQVLAEWVLAAREQLARCNRVEIGDEKIGEVLARSPVGSDGIWPAEPVRDLIEQLESRDLEDGISLGIYNSRGMTSRAMMEGGVQERDLEHRYRIWSEATATLWPRTSRALRKIANGFGQDGHRWDDSADRDDLRWG